MKKIEAIKTGLFFYDDGESNLSLRENFESQVYCSFDDMMFDLYLLSKNEDFKFALAHETESHFPRRTPEKRQALLVKKVHAQRRYQDHLEKGGTELQLSGMLADFDKKKARH